ncbi:MAG: PorT family protein [Cyclobacteriaceae bacterium]|nr:PorT family protein [Cyclobacteriaceae bacterium HetDA_MAG_MS6]
MRYLLLLTSFLLLAHLAQAQNCTQILNEAEDDYDAGRLAGIPGKLRNCLRGDSFSKEEKIRAHKLLTLVYIFSDDDFNAERSLINLLKADKEHKLDPQVDPAELFFLYDKFQTKPVLRLSLKFGGNLSLVNVIENHGAYNTSIREKEYNKASSGSGISFPTAEIMAERYLKSGVEVGAGVQFRISRYGIAGVLDVKDQSGNETPTINYSAFDQQTWVGIPLLARYHLGYDNQNSLIPYVLAGMQIDYLLSSKFTEASRSGGTPFTLDAADADLIDQRNQWNYSLFAGVGVKLRQEVNFLTLEFRYSNNLLYHNKPETRYNNQDINFALGHTDDDLSLNFLSFTIGYSYSLYNPRKMKEFR